MAFHESAHSASSGGTEKRRYEHYATAENIGELCNDQNRGQSTCKNNGLQAAPRQNTGEVDAGDE